MSDDLDVKETTVPRKGPPPGKYHCRVSSVDRTTYKDKDYVKITFEVLAGTVANQRNQRIFEQICLTEASGDRRRKLAYQMGLISKDESQKAGITIPFSKLRDPAHSHFVLDYVEDDFVRNDGSKKCKVTYAGIWAVNSPDVADVPKDMETILADGVSMNGVPQNGKPTPADDVSDL